MKRLANFINKVFNISDRSARYKTAKDKFKELSIEELKNKYGLSTFQTLEELRDQSDLSKYIPTLEEETFAKLEELTQKLNDQELELIREKNYWKTTFDNIPDPIIIIDFEYNITNYNRAFKKLIKLSDSEIRDKKCYQLLPCVSMDADKTVDIHACERVKNCTISESILSDKYFIFSKNPIFDLDTGETLAYIIVMIDITKIKENKRLILLEQKNMEALNNIFLLLLKKNVNDDVFFGEFINNLFDILNSDFCFVVETDKKTKIHKIVYNKSISDKLSEENLYKIFNQYYNMFRVTNSNVVNSNDYLGEFVELNHEWGISSILIARPDLENVTDLYICMGKFYTEGLDYIWKDYEITTMNIISKCISIYFLIKGCCHDEKNEN